MHDYYQQLKKESFHLHKKLDQLPLMKRLLSDAVKLEDYFMFLTGHLFVYQELNKTKNDSFLSARIDQLEKDLFELTKKTQFTFPKGIAFSSSNHACFLVGVNYVLEGGRHGAVFIIKHLKKSIPALAKHSFNFLNYSSERSWEGITKEIEVFAEQDYTSLLSGVNHTYQLFIDTFTEIEEQQSK